MGVCKDCKFKAKGSFTCKKHPNVVRIDPITGCKSWLSPVGQSQTDSPFQPCMRYNGRGQCEDFKHKSSMYVEFWILLIWGILITGFLVYWLTTL